MPDPQCVKKVILCHNIPLECRSQFDIGDRGDNQHVIHLGLNGLRRRFRKDRISLQNVYQNARVNDPSHAVSPSRISAMYSAVVVGLSSNFNP